ncbi:hypothetical protein QEN19_001874 [Hanseniaspora menglaensis]
MDYQTYNHINNSRSRSFSSITSFSTNDSVFSNNSYGSNNIQQITELNNYYNSQSSANKNNQIFQFYNSKEISNDHQSQLTRENLLLNEYHKQLQSIQNLANNNNKTQLQNFGTKSNDGSKKLFKTELCTKYVLSNECPYNEKCQFAHGLKELQTRQVNSKFKSKMCKNYNKTGYCRYGDRCQFKHGENINSNRHFYIKQNEPQNCISTDLVSESPSKQWVANVKYIDKVNNW